MADVSLRGLRKSFGQVEVLKGIDLDIEDGEFVVFVGPSGCGKSTLLRMIAGLEDITAGELYIDGKLCNEEPPKRRGAAMVFQSYALYPHKTVRANMAFNLRISGISKAEIEKKVQAAAQTLEIAHLLHRKPGQLSGGQRQRVAIGRAIVRDPAIFLFDEPLSNLDAALRVNMRMEIARLHHKLGTTMAYVTHDQVEAMTLADRIIILDEGIARQVGTPMDLYLNPADMFVAGFMGSPRMNFLPATVQSATADGVAVTLKSGQEVVVPVEGGPDAGAPVTLGVRPEDAPPTDSNGHVAGEVEVVERLGAQTQLGVRLADGTLMVSIADGQVPIRVGANTALRFTPQNLHLFGPDERAFRRRAARS